MGNNRWVHLMFVFGGAILAVLLVKATGWVWGFFDKPQAVVVDVVGITLAAVAAFVAWRNKNTFQQASEIVMELKKVTWPTRKETSAATVVVIVTVIIASIFLGIFDMVWSWATGLLYS